MNREIETMQTFKNDDGYVIQKMSMSSGLHPVELVDQVVLTEEEAKKVVTWLMRELPSVPGVPF